MGKAATAGIHGTPVKDNPFLAALGGKEEWERFLAKVRESKLTLGIWLMSADVAGIEDRKLILSFTPQNRFAMEMIRQDGNRRLIESHLEKFYGRKFTVEACETIDLDSGAGPGRQAEMEITARTKPGSSDNRPLPGKEGVKTGGRLAADEGSGKKPRSSKKKKSRNMNVNNPTLKRIMDVLDAELLD
jgi:hypothetical protein